MILRGLNKGQKKLIFATKPNIFIFSAYTDACTSSCKIVVASKRPLIFTRIQSFKWTFSAIQRGREAN